MHYFRISLIFACCVFWYVAFTLNEAYVSYEARRNEYFDISAVQCVKTRSAIECCALCDQDDACETINYDRENSECELLPQRPQLRDDFVTRLNWTFYMKPVNFDEDWVYFNQSYYLLVKEQMDWYHADGYCVTLGAELADIHSAEEHTFVINYLSPNRFQIGYIWIGLNDIAVEGSFRWSSGRPTTYTAFYPGEPDGGPENCVYIAINYLPNPWTENLCSYSFEFICEKSNV